MPPAYPEPASIAVLLRTGLLPAVHALLVEAAAEAARLRLPLYLVGGTVRDLLLGFHPNDLDLTVEGDAPLLARALAERLGAHPVIHPRFGTATVRLAGGQELDLATARAESYPRPGALPEVRPGTLLDDLRRRDFGLNAVAVRLDGRRWGGLVDPLGGVDDLRARRVRVLHDRSFVDDPTRLFRAVRYCGRLGFALEPETGRLVERDAPLTKLLTPDRVRHELERILDEPVPEAPLTLAEVLGLLRAVHPRLAFAPDAAIGFASARRAAPDGMDRVAAGVALLVWGLEGAAVQEIADRLNLTRLQLHAARDAAALCVEQERFALPDARPSEVTAALDEHRPEAVVALAGRGAEPLARERAVSYLLHWRGERPHLTGRDLIALGVKPGPALGRLLERLRAARLDGEAATADSERALVAAWLQSDGERATTDAASNLRQKECPPS